MKGGHPGEKYSLWLMPTGEVYDRLAAILGTLSARHGAPEFAPHVTLLGSIVALRREVLTKGAELAATIRPFQLNLEEIDYLDQYFRCLFARVAITRLLRAAHAKASEIYGRPRDPFFMPHLSLLYGNFSRGVKEAAKAELGARLDLTFKARCLHVYTTAGEPRHWRRVARFGLE